MMNRNSERMSPEMFERRRAIADAVMKRNQSPERQNIVKAFMNPPKLQTNKTLQWLSQNAPPGLVQRVKAGQVSPADALRAVTGGRNPAPTQMDEYDRGGPASDPGYVGKLHDQMMGEGYSQSLPPDEELREELGDEAFRRYQGMNEQQRLDYLNDPANGFIAPSPLDLRSLIQRDANVMPQSQNSFADSGNYRTADMTGIKPSGVGEQSQLNATARSFQGLMQSLQDYERMFENGGSTAWPGKRKDELATAHRDLQMQMKELYNLGVLNGPDLMLMDQILLDPTSIMGNVKDAFGIADMEERIPANIREVRRMMTNRSTPALQQLGIDPQSLMPPRNAGEMSDDELLRALGE